MKKYLVLNITFEWVCKLCGKHKPSRDDEEWPFCCGGAMKYTSCKHFTVEEK